jgi:hypothetical protein
VKMMKRDRKIRERKSSEDREKAGKRERDR